MSKKLFGLTVAVALSLCVEPVSATPISDTLIVLDPTHPTAVHKIQCTEGAGDIDQGCAGNLVFDVDPTKIQSPDAGAHNVYLLEPDETTYSDFITLVSKVRVGTMDRLTFKMLSGGDPPLFREFLDTTAVELKKPGNDISLALYFGLDNVTPVPEGLQRLTITAYSCPSETIEKEAGPSATQECDCECDEVSEVPEPGTLALVVPGLLLVSCLYKIRLNRPLFLVQPEDDADGAPL